MFILQNGKVYIQDKNKLVGVEIYTDNVIKVKGTETEFLDVYEIYDAVTIKKKFNIREDNPYIFPQEKGVDVNEPINNAKRVTRKSNSK